MELKHQRRPEGPPQPPAGELKGPRVDQTSTRDGSTTRDRLLETAIRLFSARGYAATSIADIQQACGLAPGSGALYKHFGSKQELLQAAVRRRLDRIAAARRLFDAEAHSTIEDALRSAGQLIFESFTDNTDLVRIMVREAEAFPELGEEMWQGIIDNGYRRFADELRAANTSGVLSVPDPDATGAVLIAALAHHSVLHAMTGRIPGDIDEERFFETWLQHAMSVVMHQSDR